MKEKYTLFMGNLVMDSNSFAELKAISENGSDPYEIFLIRQSAMNNKLYFRKTLTESDVEKAIELIQRGRILKDIAQQLHVGRDTLSRAIKEYRLENPIIEK